MRTTILEGTPEEIIKIVRALYPEGSSLISSTGRENSASTTQETASDESNDPEEPKRFVSTEFARRVLTRRPLSDAQLLALRAIQEAYPDWVTREDLCTVTGYTAHQLAGLMGAFGRRVSHTEGYPDGANFFDWKWNDKAGAWDYRFPETVHEALRLEELA